MEVATGCELTEVEYIPLTNPADLGKALERALRIGYRGSVSAHIFNGIEYWRIELNGPGNPKPAIATIGDVFVYHSDPGYLKVMPNDLFERTYTTKDDTLATSSGDEVQWFPLESATDLGAALDGLQPYRYFGKMYSENGAPLTIELAGPGNPEPIKATLGDVLIWHNPPGVLESMPRGRFMNMYTPQAAPVQVSVEEVTP